ncbi:MAG: SDR family NAD(P)-dependent oxidoreductase, partial [Haloarculaceae archaeon]
KTIDINLTGAFLCSKYVGREMIDDGGGSIINISSMSAFMANYPQCQVDYQASKGGLEGFKYQLASEWAEHDIRVNNINPGYIATEILTEDQEILDTWKSEMLMDELGTPEDIAPLAVYLASDASSYMTGESVVIDGGYLVE